MVNNNIEQTLFQTIVQFYNAYKALDYVALERLCTPEMYSKQFGLFWKIQYKLSKIISSKQWEKISVSDIQIESISPNQAEITYQVVFLAASFKERAQLVLDGRWKISGKKGISSTYKDL